MKVLGILPRCDCGWPAQTVRHILLQYTLYDRTELIRNTSTERLTQVLSQPKSARAAATWFIAQGVRKQFHTARDTESEGISELTPFPSLSS